MKKVFLGGTCNESTWRDQLIPMLKLDYFNPVVPDWNEQAYKQELIERETCDFVLYVITPKMSGVYSIAEAATDSCIRPEKTVCCVLAKDENQRWELGQLKSLVATLKLLQSNGAKCFDKLEDVANYLNNQI